MAKLSSIACVVSLLVGAGAASATTINVAILSALGTDKLNNDVLAKIQPNAPLLNIEVIPVNTGTPQPDDLTKYAAVMVIGSQPFQDPVHLGSYLAQYIDNGHSVIITALSNTLGVCPAAGTQLCGDFQDSGYWAIKPGAQIGPNIHATLGTVLLPNDPIFAGVAAGSLGFDGGTFSTRINGAVDAAATLVAKWSDGTPFAATRTFSSGALEIGLNFMPVSNDGYTGNWLTTSQGGKILGNAFNEAAGVYNLGQDGDVPEPGTYLGVGAGLGVVALLMRRRRTTLQCESAQRSSRF
jgi:hypothetical protein